jgi:hypothetical protein
MAKKRKREVTANAINWKLYLTVTAESLIAFYLATFSLAMYFVHRPVNWLVTGIFLIVLYLFVIIVCAKHVFEKLPLSAVMLIIPIAPLFALIIVISLIPIIQFLH